MGETKDRGSQIDQVNIAWAHPARDDLLAIREYVEFADVRRAQNTVLHLLRMVELLASTPFIGRPGRVKGTRELVLTKMPYIVVYRATANVIEVLRVLHTARRWPPRDE